MTEKHNFVIDFERWFDAVGDEKSNIALQLLNSYRSAWLSEGEESRVCILLFVSLAHSNLGYDLILEGLRSKELIAQRAADALLYLAGDKIDLGPDSASALVQFRENFPDAHDLFLAIETVFTRNDWSLPRW